MVLWSGFARWPETWTRYLLFDHLEVFDPLVVEIRLKCFFLTTREIMYSTAHFVTDGVIARIEVERCRRCKNCVEGQNTKNALIAYLGWVCAEMVYVFIKTPVSLAFPPLK